MRGSCELARAALAFRREETETRLTIRGSIGAWIKNVEPGGDAVEEHVGDLRL